jgi:hypothetical protein
MKNSIFMDGIANIVMVDGVVRFDLVTLANAGQVPPKDAPPQVDVVATLATTMPGFLRLHEQMQGVINKMLEQGLLKKNLPPDSAGPSAPAVSQ